MNAEPMLKAEAMDLARAKKFAAQISEWISPHVFKLEIAGSIRRERPLCNDIDIVCIPKLKAHATGLFGEAQIENTLLTFLKSYVKEGRGCWRTPTGEPGPEPQFDAKNLLLQLPKCQLDLWCANNENFVTRLVCRTGSREHNIWLAQRAKVKGFRWQPYEGLQRDGVTVAAATEEELYRWLGLPFIEPKNRELQFLERNFGR